MKNTENSNSPVDILTLPHFKTKRHTNTQGPTRISVNPKTGARMIIKPNGKVTLIEPK